MSCKVVVTLLSPSATASQRLLSRILKWTGSNGTIQSHETLRDSLNGTVRFSLFNRTLDSMAISVGADTILHCLHVHQSDSKAPFMQLLALQTTESDEPIRISRERLTEMSNTGFGSSVRAMVSSMRGNVVRSLQSLLQPAERLPILDLSGNPKIIVQPRRGDLKELCIPTFVEDTYQASGWSLLDTLRVASNLSRPAIGVYQYAGLRIRPLPMSHEDRVLPPVSLVFHDDDKNKNNHDAMEDGTTQIFRIGRSGACEGQVMLRDPLYADLDVRLCTLDRTTPMFAEAQESLMAGSLAELQSQHVHGSTKKVDPMVNRADCWVETRANLKHPRGFWKSSTPRVAKAPNIPYE